ncbi:hypothetical protein ACFL2O_04685 [Thermodesulfobacteriota bacterium]
MKPNFLEITVKTETGSYDLEAGARWIGDDLLVSIWGGEKPHIGAVSAAQSRPSLRDPEAISATASVLCFLSHKEDELAKAVSEVLAAALDTRVVVTAGIHWDNITQEGIQQVLKNSETLVELILEKISQS